MDEPDPDELEWPVKDTDGAFDLGDEPTEETGVDDEFYRHDVWYEDGVEKRATNPRNYDENGAQR